MPGESGTSSLRSPDFAAHAQQDRCTARGPRREIRDRGFNVATLLPDDRRAPAVICGRRKNAPLIRATTDAVR
jgi:hypothetical protein